MFWFGFGFVMVCPVFGGSFGGDDLLLGLLNFLILSCKLILFGLWGWLVGFGSQFLGWEVVALVF